MDKQFEADGDSARAIQKDRAIQKEMIDRQKRPYRTPRLVTYGNLRELTLAKAGSKSDGGAVSPPSRM